MEQWGVRHRDPPSLTLEELRNSHSIQNRHRRPLCPRTTSSEATVLNSSISNFIGISQHHPRLTMGRRSLKILPIQAFATLSVEIQLHDASRSIDYCDNSKSTPDHKIWIGLRDKLCNSKVLACFRVCSIVRSLAFDAFRAEFRYRALAKTRYIILPDGTEALVRRASKRKILQAVEIEHVMASRLDGTYSLCLDVRRLWKVYKGLRCVGKNKGRNYPWALR